jgi:hypothetical protein
MHNPGHNSDVPERDRVQCCTRPKNRGKNNPCQLYDYAEVCLDPSELGCFRVQGLGLDNVYFKHTIATAPLEDLTIESIRQLPSLPRLQGSPTEYQRNTQTVS